jgi:YceI-like domain
MRELGTSWVVPGDGKVVAVAGTLTLMGKAQPVTLSATRFNCYENPQIKREACGGDFETTIQRSKFGLGFAPGRGGCPLSSLPAGVRALCPECRLATPGVIPYAFWNIRFR